MSVNAEDVAKFICALLTALPLLWWVEPRIDKWMYNRWKKVKYSTFRFIVLIALSMWIGGRMGPYLLTLFH